MMAKAVDKEYFAFKAIQMTNGVNYMYKAHIRGIVDTLLENYGLTVPNMSVEELCEYVEHEMDKLFKQGENER